MTKILAMVSRKYFFFKQISFFISLLWGPLLVILCMLTFGCSRSESSKAKNTVQRAEPIRMEVKDGCLETLSKVIVYRGNTPILTHITEDRPGLMCFFKELYGDEWRATYTTINESIDYRNFLLDMKGNGEKRYLILTNWSGGNNDMCFKGWLIDTWDDFSVIGEIPVAEIFDYPKKNPDLIFPFFDMIAHLGGDGRAYVTVRLKIAKGRFPVCVPPEDKPLTVNIKEFRSMAPESVMYYVYCQCAENGKIHLAEPMLKKLGIPQKTIDKHRFECLNALRHSKLYPYLVQINGKIF